MSNQELRLGLYEADLNPALGLPIAGYTYQKIASGFHDRLYVKAISLRSRDDRVLLASVDTCGVGKQMCAEIKQEMETRHGVPSDNVVILATHSHSAPDTLAWSLRWNKRTSPEIEEAMVSNRDRTREIISWSLSQAMAFEEPVSSVHFSSVRTPGLFTNREDRSRKIDDTVTVMMMKGKKSALILNHHYHPTVLGANNYDYSADFPAYLTERVKEKIGVDQVNCITGACGEVSVRLVLGDEFAPRRNIANTMKYGVRLADYVVRSLKFAKQLKDFALNSQVRHLKLDVKKKPTWEETRALKQDLEDRIKRAKNAREKTALEFRLEGVIFWLDTLDLYGGQLPSTLDADVGAVKLGADGLAFAWAPAEICSHTGFVVKERSRYKVTMLSGYGNGIIGYMPSAQSYKNQEYEALSTPVTETAIDRIEEALTSMVS